MFYIIDATMISLVNGKPAVPFLPARRYASAGNCDRNVSVRPSVRLTVRLSVCHAPVLCQNE